MRSYRVLLSPPKSSFMVIKLQLFPSQKRGVSRSYVYLLFQRSTYSRTNLTFAIRTFIHNQNSGFRWIRHLQMCGWYYIIHILKQYVILIFLWRKKSIFLCIICDQFCQFFTYCFAKIHGTNVTKIHYIFQKNNLIETITKQFICVFCKTRQKLSKALLHHSWSEHFKRNPIN